MSTYVRLGSKPTRVGLDMPEVPGAWKETSGRLAPGAPVSTCAGVSAEAMGRTLNMRALRLAAPRFTALSVSRIDTRERSHHTADRRRVLRTVFSVFCTRPLSRGFPPVRTGSLASPSRVAGDGV